MWESRLSGSERALREGVVEENSTRQPSWLLDCLTDLLLKRVCASL